jgi:hypothetical protein
MAHYSRVWPYADDLPAGVDLRFNTNKSKAEAPGKLDAMKKQDMADPLNPFGAVIKPGGQRGVMNIVNEEGDWGKWSKNLSSQMLSKQTPVLAKQQLDLAMKRRQDEYEDHGSPERLSGRSFLRPSTQCSSACSP